MNASAIAEPAVVVEPSAERVVEESPPAVAIRAAFAPDNQLELQVQRRLGSRIRDLRVIIRQDGVILKGHTATYHAKQLAQHAAMELGALPIVANDIEVY